MSDIREEEWQEWNIALADFTGVNTRKIAKISIGFGDGTDPGDPPTGAGTVYFDDFQIHPIRCAVSERGVDFAVVDYSPAGMVPGDCVVDNGEIEVMSDTWLAQGLVVDTKNPGDTNLVLYYPLNEGDGNRVYPDPCDSIWTGTTYNSALTPPINTSVLISSDSAPGIGGTGCLYVAGLEGYRVQCGTYGQADLGIGANAGDINAITLSMWTKWLGQRTWDAYLLLKGQGLIGKRGGYAEDQMIWTFWISADPGIEGALGLGHYSSGDTRRPDTVSAGGTMDTFIGQWVHVAATYPTLIDGNSQAILYLNGGPIDNGPWRFSHGLDPNIFLTIGQTSDQNAWPNAPSSYYGYIDEVRIYNRALEPNEIAYLADTTPEDGKLLIPVPSLAEVYEKEPEDERVVNFRDFAMVADRWLDEYMFPYEP